MPSGSTVNVDLQRERDKCTFNPKELTYLLDGDEKKTEERRAREESFLSDPDIKDSVPAEYLSHKEKYEQALRKACHVFKKVQGSGEDAGMEQYREIIGGRLGAAILKDGSPLTLHYVMFIPTLMGQGTLVQQAEWITRAWNCNIIGTYAQTELGHGTFVRGLETTAEYDEETQEFILNSPTLTSYKWWPGGLGHTANYAIVLAQLHTKGECHGIHAFIVQLRDEETHMPMPGIKVGEIGTKLGMNGTNNGYLGMEKVRIPRMHMLMKNAQVLEDGTYVKSPSSKLTYGTMMFVRVVLIQDMSVYLSKAVTIATRYSAVRRQSQPKPNEPEPQIIDYVTQQYKLFPNIATVYAYKMTSNWLWEHYNEVSSELDAGELDRLPELHALSCCLKAVCTSDVAKAVEVCRLACGGHGYMACSNLPAIYGLVTAACTYEGENTVMLLQTARFLIKAWHQAQSGSKMTPTVKYFTKVIKKRYSRWNTSIEGIIEGFHVMAAGLVNVSSKNIAKLVNRGVSEEDAWNMTSIQLVAAAEAHCRSFIIEKFCEEMFATIKNVSASLKEVLTTLLEVYCVYWALNCSGDLLRFTSITEKDIEALQLWLEDLLAKIRPNAVGLVDGFDLRDEILSSALGAYDGRVYERLMEEAQKSPLNAEPVNKSFHNYLKPLMKSQL